MTHQKGQKKEKGTHLLQSVDSTSMKFEPLRISVNLDRKEYISAGSHGASLGQSVSTADSTDFMHLTSLGLS